MKNNIIHLSDICFRYSSKPSPSIQRQTSKPSLQASPSVQSSAYSQDLVLDIKDFQMQNHEKVFLYGPSGCGKTTLLEILAGVLVPQQGQVIICDNDLMKMSSMQRDAFRANHIGYIFQSFNLIPYLNVEENITLPVYLSQQRQKKLGAEFSHDLLKEKVVELCTQLGIQDFIHKSVSELSVGQQQRVAAARALLGHPELILADEPTSALDFDHRERFIRLLFDVCQKAKTSVLFVSHDRTLQSLFDRSVSLLDINKVAKNNLYQSQ